MYEKAKQHESVKTASWKQAGTQTTETGPFSCGLCGVSPWLQTKILLGNKYTLHRSILLNIGSEVLYYVPTDLSSGKGGP